MYHLLVCLIYTVLTNRVYGVPIHGINTGRQIINPGRQVIHYHSDGHGSTRRHIHTYPSRDVAAMRVRSQSQTLRKSVKFGLNRHALYEVPSNRHFNDAATSKRAKRPKPKTTEKGVLKNKHRMLHPLRRFHQFTPRNGIRQIRRMISNNRIQTELHAKEGILKNPLTDKPSFTQKPVRTILGTINAQSSGTNNRFFVPTKHWQLTTQKPTFIQHQLQIDIRNENILELNTSSMRQSGNIHPKSTGIVEETTVKMPNTVLHNVPKLISATSRSTEFQAKTDSTTSAPSIFPKTTVRANSGTANGNRVTKVSTTDRNWSVDSSINDVSQPKPTVPPSELIHLRGIHIMFTNKQQQPSQAVPTIHLTASVVRDTVPAVTKSTFRSKNVEMTTQNQMNIKSIADRPAEPSILRSTVDKIVGTAMIRGGHLFLLIYPSNVTSDVAFNASAFDQTRASGMNKEWTTPIQAKDRTSNERTSKSRTVTERTHIGKPTVNNKNISVSSHISHTNIEQSIKSNNQKLQTNTTHTKTKTGTHQSVHSQNEHSVHTSVSASSSTSEKMTHSTMQHHHHHHQSTVTETMESTTNQTNIHHILLPIQRFMSPWSRLNLSTVYPHPNHNYSKGSTSDDDSDVKVISFVEKATDPFEEIKSILTTLINATQSSDPAYDSPMGKTAFNFELKLSGETKDFKDVTTTPSDNTSEEKTTEFDRSKSDTDSVPEHLTTAESFIKSINPSKTTPKQYSPSIYVPASTERTKRATTSTQTVTLPNQLIQGTTPPVRYSSMESSKATNGIIKPTRMPGDQSIDTTNLSLKTRPSTMFNGAHELHVAESIVGNVPTKGTADIASKQVNIAMKPDMAVNNVGEKDAKKSTPQNLPISYRKETSTVSNKIASIPQSKISPGVNINKSRAGQPSTIIPVGKRIPLEADSVTPKLTSKYTQTTPTDKPTATESPIRRHTTSVQRTPTALSPRPVNTRTALPPRPVNSWTALPRRPVHTRTTLPPRPIPTRKQPHHFHRDQVRGPSEKFISLADILNDLKKLQLHNMLRLNLHNNGFNNMLAREVDPVPKHGRVVIEAPLFGNLGSEFYTGTTTTSAPTEVPIHTTTTAPGMNNYMTHTMNDVMNAILVMSVEDMLNEQATLHGALLLSNNRDLSSASGSSKKR